MSVITPQQAVNKIMDSISQNEYDLHALVYNLFCSDNPKYECTTLPMDLFCMIIYQTQEETKIARVYKNGVWTLED